MDCSPHLYPPPSPLTLLAHRVPHSLAHMKGRYPYPPLSLPKGRDPHSPCPCLCPPSNPIHLHPRVILHLHHHPVHSLIPPSVLKNRNKHVTSAGEAMPDGQLKDASGTSGGLCLPSLPELFGFDWKEASSLGAAT